jgi:hypothetical protein
VLLAAVLRVALEGVALLCAGSDAASECEPITALGGSGTAPALCSGASLRTGGDGEAPSPNADRQPVEPSVSTSDAEARKTGSDRGRGGPQTRALPAPSLASALLPALGCPARPTSASHAIIEGPAGRRPPPRGPPR